MWITSPFFVTVILVYFSANGTEKSKNVTSKLMHIDCHDRLKELGHEIELVLYSHLANKRIDRVMENVSRETFLDRLAHR